MGRYMASKRFDLKQQELFLVLMREGLRRGAAAERLGFARRTVVSHIEDHPDFEALVVDAEGKANELVEEAVFSAAISGSVQAARLWFEYKNMRPANAVPSAGKPPGAADVDYSDDIYANVTALDPRSRNKQG